MTQELFNKAVSGVIKQGCLAKSDPNNEIQDCYYRHPDDPSIRCAVGHLIPDEEYRWDMEGLRAPLLKLSFKLPVWAGDLQRAHDGAQDLEQFLKEASKVAKRNGLEMPS